MDTAKTQDDSSQKSTGLVTEQKSPLTGSNKVLSGSPLGNPEEKSLGSGPPSPLNDSSTTDGKDKEEEGVKKDEPLVLSSSQGKAPSKESQNTSTADAPSSNGSDPSGSDSSGSGSVSSGVVGTSGEGINMEDFKGKTISEILHLKGSITDSQLEEIKYDVANKKGSEEEILRSKGWVDEDKIVNAKAASYGVPFVDLTAIDTPTEVLTKLPYDVAKTHKAVLFKEEANLAHVGMVDPLDIQRAGYIENVLKKKIKTYFASPGDIKSILDTKYTGRMESEVTEAVEEVGEGVMQIQEGIKDISEVEDTIASAPVARIVNMILEYAVKFKASDIHIEPREKKLAVRFRINGVMVERLQLPVKLISSIVSRVKILSNLKIDEHRVPQDGRFQIKVGTTEVDLRVSVMPTVHGEKVVIRLLEKGAGLRKLEETGLRGSGYKTYREGLSSTQGIMLVTGPTGSGKTQTLASSLLILNTPDVNIVTLEDPVEVKVDGVNQIQVNADVGLTFAKGLRSVLRQDPDIIMVGEIRDEETAELAVQASLTGHLVLATLHTNSASGALPRLLDMHVEPYLITSTVNIIVGQRLVRTICEGCKEAYEAPPEVVQTIHKVMAGLAGFDMYSFPKRDNQLASPGQVNTTDPTKIPPAEVEKQQQAKSIQKVTLYRGKGCGKCNHTGYSGRTGIFEVLKVSEKISQLIMEHRSAGTIEKQAIAEGMITMIQDGFMKALEGITTIEEVFRVQQK
jgi:type IV pilus assembly protein PilB